MIDNTELLILAIIIISCSNFFLKYILGFKITTANCATTLVFALAGIAACTQLRSFTEAIIFFIAAIIQFASFVFVSRLRQRGSLFWHSLAALGSNGAWYITMGILSQSNAYWMLFIPHIIGIVVGRTAGSAWAQYVEQEFNLKSDATRDDRLAPGKRLAFISKEVTFWVLLIGLVVYITYSYFGFETALFESILIVIGLGLLQNFFYALNARASARGSNWYIAITGLLSGIAFYISAVYLFSRNMPMVLFIPYTLSTTLGSTTGAFFSMIIEWIAGDSPDAHLEKDKSDKKKNSKAPYVVILLLALTWIFLQEPIFRLFGFEVSRLKFPISVVTTDLPRVLIMMTASLIFLFDSALHTLNSRAGNRNHTGYHIVTCIPKGLIDFSKVSYIAQNSRLLDILPVGILASCLGSLYAKDISEKIERWLQARMDVVEEKK